MRRFLLALALTLVTGAAQAATYYEGNITADGGGHNYSCQDIWPASQFGVDQPGPPPPSYHLGEHVVIDGARDGIRLRTGTSFDILLGVAMKAGPGFLAYDGPFKDGDVLATPEGKDISHIVFCFGAPPPPPPPPCDSCECDPSLCPPPPPPPPEKPCTPLCDEVVTVSLTDECGGTNEVIVFNRYGGDTFDVLICVDNVPYETRTFTVPHFPLHRKTITGLAGYDCPATWTVRLNPMPPQVCQPWLNQDALDVWAMSP